MALDSNQLADLRDRHQLVRDRIAAASARAKRRLDEITLVAVTKTATVDQILGLIDLGQHDLGENRVQQLMDRAQAVSAARPVRTTHAGPHCAHVPNSPIPDAPIPNTAPRWHMIGHLQRNKVRDVVPLVTLIQSVDSLRLAQEIESFCTKRGAGIDVLLQVNIADEEQKFGLAAAEVEPLAQQIAAEMPHLRLRGLMTMAPYSDRAEDSRPVFAQTAAIFHELKSRPWIGGAFDRLSMGMTNDFEVAIQEGANILRVGRALFEV